VIFKIKIKFYIQKFRSFVHFSTLVGQMFQFAANLWKKFETFYGSPTCTRQEFSPFRLMACPATIIFVSSQSLATVHIYIDIVWQLKEARSNGVGV
jgi:hypothetical protein